MAKIHEELILIKLSTLTKDTVNIKSLITDELTESLVTVIEELVPEGVVVEVEQP
jgi:hypothetical protein